MNYINHLSLYRRERLAEIGGLREGFDGSQDFDLLLRYLAGLDPAQVLHLPYPAYLWRRDGHSYSVAFLDRSTRNARRALAEAYAMDDVPAPVEPALAPNLHRVIFEATIRSWPKDLDRHPQPGFASNSSPAFWRASATHRLSGPGDHRPG